MREVRGFLGLAGCYRRLVKNYGSVGTPLTQFLKAGAYKWSIGSKNKEHTGLRGNPSYQEKNYDIFLVSIF